MTAATLRELAQAALEAPESWMGPLRIPVPARELLALLDQLDAAQEALRLADAALLAYKAQAEFWVPEADAAIAAARARQEEP